MEISLFSHVMIFSIGSLLNETGTGKTHTAKLIHDLSPTRQRPFAVNCAELTPSIIEAEFGVKEDVLRQLETAPWHGDIRELRSFVEKACLDALFAADATGDRSHKIILARDIVRSRLNKKALTVRSSQSSPLAPWPAIHAWPKNG